MGWGYLKIFSSIELNRWSNTNVVKYIHNKQSIEFQNKILHNLLKLLFKLNSIYICIRQSFNPLLSMIYIYFCDLKWALYDL